MCCRSSFATIAIALLLGACASSTPLELYEKDHPDWKPDFPRVGVDARETLASVYAPHEIEKGSITEVRSVRAFTLAPRADLDLDAFQRGAPGLTLLAVQVACSAPKPLDWFYNDAVSWFALKDGRLEAWRSFRFGEHCNAAEDAHALDASLEQAIADAEVASSLIATSRPPPNAPTPAANAAEAACPGTAGFASALRGALEREPTVHTFFVSHDLVLTIAVEADGSFELEKIRPTDFFARQMVQQVRKVSGAPDRPEPPDCLLGKTVELEFPRATAP